VAQTARLESHFKMAFGKSLTGVKKLFLQNCNSNILCQENLMGKLSILGEFWAFMRVRKKWWLGPILFVMLLLSMLIVLTQGSALAPFIYTLF
jgi:hypothetical protein